MSWPLDTASKTDRAVLAVELGLLVNACIDAYLVVGPTAVEALAQEIKEARWRIEEATKRRNRE